MKRIKVHRAHPAFAGAASICGGDRRVYDVSHHACLTDAQFAWLPDKYQCWRCRAALPFPAQVSADDVMQTIVDTIIVSILRAIDYMREMRVGPHVHVWLPYVCGVEGVDPKVNPWRCSCGAFSRDGQTVNGGGGESFHGIHRSVAQGVLSGSRLGEPTPSDDDIRRAVEELLRTDERLEWRQPRSRCGGAID